MTQKNRDIDSCISATAEIVASYLTGNHRTGLDELDALIDRIYGKLRSLDGAEGEGRPSTETAGRPALPAGLDAESSITPDYIICLEDGKKLKMLKRYLKTNFNMTPEEYRKRWSLPATYPMVAPNYAKKRSKLAKEIGLGRKPDADGKRGRPKKVAAPVRQKGLAKPRGELPKGKGKLKIVKSTDMMKAHVSE